jgi:hypothetical protein
MNTKTDRELVKYLESALNAPGLNGCGDSSCIVKRPVGMCTNGGCRCFSDLRYSKPDGMHKFILVQKLINASRQLIENANRGEP